ncbi:hypothetical protein ABK046_49085, partial [Streptomyces caeruleatus]
MKPATLEKLKAAEQYCNDNDKSTMFMIQYMQDVARVSFDTVMKYLNAKAEAEPVSRSKIAK